MPTHRTKSDEQPEEPTEGNAPEPGAEEQPDETPTKNTPGTDPETGEEAQVDAPDSNPADEVGAGQIQAQFDEINRKGYYGETPDQRDADADTLSVVAKRNQ
jgi:hypothetical protein